MFSMIVLFLLLLCCSAFFSASETTLFSLSRIHVHKLKESGGWAAEKIISSLRRPRELMVTILLGNELVNVAISIVGAAMISRLVSCSVEAQTFIAVVAITPIILIFGEILPKNAALHYAAQLAPVMIVPIQFFYRLIAPLRVVLTWIAERVVRLFGGRTAADAPMIMEQEFRRLVDLGRKGGVIVEEEREIIHNVFEFTDKVVRGIMTPAERIFALPIDMPYEKIIEEIKSTQFSRVPFYEVDFSRFVGILHVRDLFSFHRRKAASGEHDLRTLLRQPLFVAEATPLEDLLKEFQRTQLHMAIVKGEQGEVAGVVTMDDVQEELFGEMEE